MVDLSAVIQKPILNVESSRILGRVTDVYFDEYCKRAVYFCVELNYGKESLLPFEEVQSFSDALVVNGEVGFISPLDVDLTALQGNVINMPIYTLGGLHKGDVRDVSITNAGKVARISNGNEGITPSSISKIGDVILLNSNAKIKSVPRRIPRPEKDYPVYALKDGASKSTSKNKPSPNAEQSTAVKLNQTVNIEGAKTALPLASVILPQSVVNAESAVAVSPKPIVALGSDVREPVLSNGAFEMLLDGSSAFSYEEDTRTPTRIICDYEFLLGRTLGADLCTYTGELIARQGSAVTDSVVEKARRAGKLVELTLNSVKPESKK